MKKYSKKIILNKKKEVKNIQYMYYIFRDIKTTLDRIKIGCHLIIDTKYNEFDTLTLNIIDPAENRADELLVPQILNTVLSHFNYKDICNYINNISNINKRLLLSNCIRNKMINAERYPQKDRIELIIRDFISVLDLKQLKEVLDMNVTQDIYQYHLNLKMQYKNYAGQSIVLWNGMGDLGCDFSFNIKSWGFGYATWDNQTSVYLDYLDGIKLFYHYFKSFETYVEKFLGEKYSSQDWFKEFKKELPKLEEIYNGYVKSGDIDDSDVEIFEPSDEEIKEFRAELGKLELK